jgi:argininosuccinate lyase
MMPQKRNPDMLELIRGKTGNVFGSLSAMLMMLKGLPSTYNRDLQEDKLHIFNAADVTSASLAMATAIVSNTKFNTKHIAAGIDEGFLDATALAEYLVSKGVPFRQAHGIVGALVAKCETEGLKLSELELTDFKAACAKIGKDVYKCLSAKNIISAYKSEGAAGTAQVTKQINYWKKKIGTRG